jgi:acetyl-CoA C-acetyltransferase
MNSSEPVVVVNGARTPIGGFGGALKDVPAHELGATAAKAALGRAGVSGQDIDEVVMGCIGQVGPDAYNARRVAITAGLPENIPPTPSTGCVVPGCRRCGRPRCRCGGVVSCLRVECI